MTSTRIPYYEHRNDIKVGDVIAFDGKGNFSNIIKAATFSDISHVGMVINSDFELGARRNMLIESTTLSNGFAGVGITVLSKVIDEYDGEVWLYPLKEELDLNDKANMTNWLFRQKGKPYDTAQAIRAGIDLGFGKIDIVKNKEDFNKLFCSELVSEALERAGVISAVNASEQTPADVCDMDCFEKRILLKGESDGVREEQTPNEEG